MRLSARRREGKKFALEVIDRKHSEILSRLTEQEAPPSSFYAFLKLTRKKYFKGYLNSLTDALETGDSTDFLGNETFQSYSHARNGYALKDVLNVPRSVRNAISGVIEEMVESGEAQAGVALGAIMLVDELLQDAEMIRAQSYTQTRDEVIRFYHSYQEEIDKFPSNLAATLDFSTLMLSAVKEALDLIGAGRCAFFTRNLMTNDLHLEASNFAHERVFGDSTLKLDDHLVEQLAHHREAVLVEGHPRSKPRTASIMKKMKTKAILLVPLMVRDRNLGIMLLDNVDRPEMFTQDTINLAIRFANKAAGAMENARLHGSEQKKIKETMALLEVSRLVTTTLDIDTLLSRLVQITADVCEVGKCTVYTCRGEENRYYPTATFGLFPDSEWETELMEGVLSQDLVEEEAELLLEKHQLVISDPAMCPFIPEDRIGETGTRSVLLVPVYLRDKVQGIMVLFFSKDRHDLEYEDLNLVEAIAGQAAVALENASLYEDLEMSYFSTVKALARAIEVKDPYTYGHSEKVTEYSIAIAGQMELSEWELRNIKYAAALHDIGKIGIARKVLNKPGALSEEEFLHVKTHPQLGDSIIEPVTFLQGPRLIILHHHERYDGKGYPDGLRGDEIPLGARILSVADSYEAMMSDRPYRKALPISEAIKELDINAGTQFDPVVVKAFLEVLRRGEFPEKQEPADEDMSFDSPWSRI